MVPQLRAEGWSVVVCPGFAHESVPVQRWKLHHRPDTGEHAGQGGGWPAGTRLAPGAKLMLPEREGAWLLTLGIEIDGETLDLAPLLADLLRRDARWLNAQQMAAIDDLAIIQLRAPGGKRIDDAPPGRSRPSWAPWWTCSTDPTRKQRQDGDPLRLGAWEARRIEALRAGLVQAHRVGTVNGWSNDWQLQAMRAWPPGPAPAPHRHAPAGGSAARAAGATAPLPVGGPGLAAIPARAGLGGILADDMGLGKTAQALAHDADREEAGRLTRPALVVLPTSLLFNWQAEAARMAPGLRVLAFCTAPTVAKRYPLQTTTWCSPPPAALA